MAFRRRPRPVDNIIRLRRRRELSPTVEEVEPPRHRKPLFGTTTILLLGFALLIAAGGGLLTLPRQQTLGLVPYSTLRAKLSSDGCCCSGCCVRSVGECEGGSFFQIQRQQHSSRKNSKGKSSKGSSSKNRGKSSKAKKHDPTVLWAQPGTAVVRSSLNHR